MDTQAGSEAEAASFLDHPIRCQTGAPGSRPAAPFPIITEALDERADCTRIARVPNISGLRGGQ